MKTLQYIFYLTLVVTVYPQRIGGGHNVTDPTMFPFFAMFIQRCVEDGIDYAAVCGGSLIHPEWILTAGHCVPNNKSRVDELIRSDKDMVYMGSVYRPEVEPPDQSRKIIEIHLHPLYVDIPHPNNSGVSLQLLNDIALLRVNKPFMLSNRVQVIRLSTSFFPYHDGIAIGIGGTDYNSEIMPKILKYAKMEMKDLYPPESKTTFYATTEMNKTYDNNSLGYTFYGDSGGPFIANYTSPPIQIGVISGGFYDNETNVMLGKMERIDFFIGFIKKHVAKDKYTKYLQTSEKVGTFRKERNGVTRSSGTLLYVIFFLSVLLSM